MHFAFAGPCIAPPSTPIRGPARHDSVLASCSLQIAMFGVHSTRKHDMACTDSCNIQCTLHGRAWLSIPPPAAVQLIVTPSVGLDLCRSQLLGCTQHAHDMPCTDSHKMQCTLRLQGHAWRIFPPHPRASSTTLLPCILISAVRNVRVALNMHMACHVLTLARFSVF